jgi:aryl-phospho-beta-D-glucosidase BglC (GH1 family)
MPVPASVIRTLAKGINLSHWLSQHSLDEPHLQSYIGEKDFALIAKLGFTHVRLPIDTALLQSPDGSLREQGFTYVDRALDWAQANRLGVVIDLHPVPAPKIAQDATAYAHFEKLWQAIAQRYVRRPLDVVYELLNEPVEANPQAWRDARHSNWCKPSARWISGTPSSSADTTGVDPTTCPPSPR